MHCGTPECLEAVSIKMGKDWRDQGSGHMGSLVEEAACSVSMITSPAGISLKSSIHKTNGRNAFSHSPRPSKLVGTVLVLFDEEPEAQGGKGLVQGWNQNQTWNPGFFDPEAL